MIEALAVGIVFPHLTCSVQQVNGTENIGFDKCQGIADAAIHVGFGGQVNHAVEAVIEKQLPHGGTVDDIAFHKFIIRCLFNCAEIGQVPGIGQFVEYDDTGIRVSFYEAVHDVATNETRATGDKDRFIFHVFHV